MILTGKELLLWIALGSFIGAIAVEEDVATTSLPEVQNHTTTTSPTTPTTTFSSSSTLSSSSEATTSSPTTPILARANLLSSNATLRSIISTTTIGTTTKPSAKRQISLNEFQQLVAKVNDEISMLRNQSANLSQAYEELVRRYNVRTSQVQVVLNDAAECSTSTTVENDKTTESSSAPSTEIETTIKMSTTNSPSRTKAVEYSTEKLTHSEVHSNRDPSLDAVPQDSGSSHTQIYGNKYYNYIHYFMYPPSEAQLENFRNPVHSNQRRKAGNESWKTGPGKQRKDVPKENTNKWQEQIESLEETEESNLEAVQSSAFRRRTQASTGLVNSKYPFGGSVPAIGGQYRFGGSFQRNPSEASTPFPSLKIPQYRYDEERIPPRTVPQAERFGFRPESKRRTPPETGPKAPVYVDQIAAFLERRDTNRNSGPTLRTTLAPPRQVTSFSTIASESATPPSIESLFSFGVKPVNYTVPSTVKPPTGVERNGWDGYDFSFVRKVQENKQRQQREQRSSRKQLRDL